jgi:hypothetical protein
VNVKHWVLALILFSAVAAFADYAFTRWAIYENRSSDAGRLYHLAAERGDEIPIFGSSKVYHDYVPAEMGVNAYNYGFDGVSYEVTDALLDIELAKHKTTPVVIDLKPQAEHGIGDPATYIPLAFDARIRRLLRATGSMAWRYYVPGIRYFGYYDEYLKEWINDRAGLMRTVERGFSHEKYWSFDRARLDAAVRQRVKGPNGYFPDETQNERLITHIREHPERLFFLVYSPVHESCFTNFQHIEQFDAFKARLAALPNAVVLDFERSGYPDEWFKDTNHLLYDGALDFSRRLGDTIRETLQRAGPPTSARDLDLRGGDQSTPRSAPARASAR